MIKTVAFDLGGVIMTIDNDEPIRRFKEIGVSDAEHMLDPYVQSGMFGDLESGQISEEMFRKKLSAHVGTELTWEQCQYAWKGYVKAVPAYSIDGLKTIRDMGYRLILASNTNGFMQSWADSDEFSGDGHPISHYFDKMYRSYEMKLMKPDELFFRTMFGMEQTLPEQILYIDDSARNCAVASEMGVRTFCPKNGADWRADVLKILEQDM